MPVVRSFNPRIASGSYGPRMVEFCQVASCNVDETTYLGVSLKNGAPGASATVRFDQGGSNISYVSRPRRMASHPAVARPIASPILGSKPYSNVHVGASMTPSRV